ncbi:hypothetical protein CDEST_00696 [Colletotrichum destructivum]|uniref:Secreted protein n=1 Tax=Colletotrichum destructivum TaxID=34406 RepID=A0AAX4HX97_9PEZI|nr:hypothetical protein CDEST_00696 [Colletotrichum destructivum]
MWWWWCWSEVYFISSGTTPLVCSFPSLFSSVHLVSFFLSEQRASSFAHPPPHLLCLSGPVLPTTSAGLNLREHILHGRRERERERLDDIWEARARHLGTTSRYKVCTYMARTRRGTHGRHTYTRHIRTYA